LAQGEVMVGASAEMSGLRTEVEVGVVAIVAFFVMWPPGPVFAIVPGGGEKKVVVSAGHRSPLRTGNWCRGHGHGHMSVSVFRG